jgi:hypothetical protein
MHQGRGHLRRRKAPRTLRKYRVTKVIEASAADARVQKLAPYID